MVLDLFKLDGQVALVTGGGSGLGQSMAIALAEAGVDIAIIYRSSYDDTRHAITALGRRCMGVQLDLAKATVPQLQGAVLQVVNQLGHLDILINAAGTTHRAPALEHSEQDWDEVLRVNLKAAFFLSQAAGAHFCRRGSGKIINICSLLSMQGGILNASYTASKTGLLGLTHLLASEWAPHGVNVNCIIPGYMDTNLCAPLKADPERSEKILARIPAGRWGTPEDVKGAVLYLASHASDYVHGASLVIDGGWMVR
jgi:2-deoxy-D-gluconate 3-dehydrogenase